MPAVSTYSALPSRAILFQISIAFLFIYSSDLKRKIFTLRRNRMDVRFLMKIRRQSFTGTCRLRQPYFRACFI
jgi:hypothetical protein